MHMQLSRWQNTAIHHTFFCLSWDRSSSSVSWGFPSLHLSLQVSAELLSCFTLTQPLRSQEATKDSKWTDNLQNYCLFSQLFCFEPQFTVGSSQGREEQGAAAARTNPAAVQVTHPIAPARTRAPARKIAGKKHSRSFFKMFFPFSEFCSPLFQGADWGVFPFAHSWK